MFFTTKRCSCEVKQTHNCTLHIINMDEILQLRYTPLESDVRFRMTLSFIFLLLVLEFVKIVIIAVIFE